MEYNWQQRDWPAFTFSVSKNTEKAVYAFNEEIGHLNGILKGLSAPLQMEAMISIMVAEAIKTSEIEGEYLSRPDVVSSIRQNLGLKKDYEILHDKKAQGVGELMVAVRNSYAAPLNNETLFAWHKMLLGYQTRISVGEWRSHQDAMRVVSGAIGKEIIHFEAPPSKTVPNEMEKFISWFNNTAPGGSAEIIQAPVRAAIAHLYFESIHPFEDGNGRMGRAIAEKALSQSIGRPVVLSLSQTIEADKKAYYNALETAQKSKEISDWIEYFVAQILAAQYDASRQVEFTLKKTKFFDQFASRLNERQLRAITKMIDAEPKGFVGGMTAKKYISITKASKATATRDLQAMIEWQILVSDGGGRSTSYRLSL